MKFVTKFSCIVRCRSHASCKLLAVALILSLYGLLMTGESHAALTIDTVDASVTDDRVEMPKTVNIDEVLTVSEFAMILAEAGLDPSLISYSDRYLCIFCLLAHPKDPEFCDPWCKDG